MARVVATPDLLERNAAITHGYHDLSEAVAALLGRDHANWLTFGQWASAGARESIDRSAVPPLVRPFFGTGIAAAVAAGNAAIFGDVAPPFIRFVTLFAAVAAPDAASAARKALVVGTRWLLPHEPSRPPRDGQRLAGATWRHQPPSECPAPGRGSLSLPGRPARGGSAC